MLVINLFATKVVYTDCAVKFVSVALLLHGIFSHPEIGIINPGCPYNTCVPCPSCPQKLTLLCYMFGDLFMYQGLKLVRIYNIYHEIFGISLHIFQGHDIDCYSIHTKVFVNY